MAVLRVRISGTAMGVFEGSELFTDPAKYDASDPAVLEAHIALHSAEARRAGKGWTYLVTVSPAGAEVLREFCADVGTVYLDNADADTRAEGRALLQVADRIERNHA